MGLFQTRSLAVRVWLDCAFKTRERFIKGQETITPRQRRNSSSGTWPEWIAEFKRTGRMQDCNLQGLATSVALEIVNALPITSRRYGAAQRSRNQIWWRLAAPCELPQRIHRKVRARSPF